ncbi:DUF1631 family protein [Chiayiivirga flava]|uniref:DUF1631 domain-containing protein n=1 Tax=Chiayiivirga flava TaxID=659595 RepID=A0A7W8D7R1_9GAMM|nr:DUF1631 family protein [Chiayiivirga flava]MBB5208277.1 hypothetical protein [Chiayiivirga flava]
MESQHRHDPAHDAGTVADTHARTAALLFAQVMHSVTDRLEPVLEKALERLGRQLFARAESGRGGEQHVALDALRHLNRTRADLLPELLRAVQHAADAMRNPRTAPDAPGDTPSDSWCLLDNAVVEEAGLIDSLGGWLETRLHLPLHLLAERIGVLFGREVPSARALACGPHALLSATRAAARALDMGFEARSMLLSQVAAELDATLPACYDLANARLRAAGVLPDLAGYRPKARIGRQRTTAGCGSKMDADAPAAPPVTDTSARPPLTGRPPLRPFAAWLDLADTGAVPAPEAERTIFDVMRHLLGGRRAFLGRGADTGAVPAHRVDPAQVQASLRDLQRTSAPGPQTQPQVGALKPALMRRLQACIPDGMVPDLDAVQADTIELVDMLFEHLLHDVAPHGTGAALLARLQVPLLRVALQDSGFFTRKQHPARRMLDTLADAGLFWLDPAHDGDAAFAAELDALVDGIASGFDGDLDVFESAATRLQRQLDERVRRAALIERRHVEAEQGRERLELARSAATNAIAMAVGAHRLPAPLHALLTGAWTDALALAALRDDPGGALFDRRVAAAVALVQRAHSARPGVAPEAEAGGAARADASTLRAVLVEGLRQVGHLEDAAAALAETALAQATGMPDAASGGAGSDTAQAEHAPDFASAARVSGEASAADDAAQPVHERAASPLPHPPAAEAALGNEARQHLERLRRLPFGTWFDLDLGDTARCRCRMSWFSPVTGRCLFVNARGQRVGDHTLAWLAQAMADGRATLVREAHASVVDIAWQSILGVLRSLTGGPVASPA